MNPIKQIHAHTLRNGIDQTQLLVLKLLQIPNIPYACSLFECAPTTPTTFLYNKLLQGYSTHGPFHRCLSLYSQMGLRGCPPNLYSFTFLFTACASLSDFHKQGQALHAQLLKFGFQLDAYVLTSLLDMYAKSGLLAQARLLFDEMPDRDVVTWNSMIGGYAKGGNLAEGRELFEAMPSRNVVSWTSMVSGYSQNGQYEEALSMFLRMWGDDRVRPNEVTIASVLPACANLGAMDLGVRIDRYVRANGFAGNLFVSNALMEMYAKCGNIDQAKRVFEGIGKRKNLCSWNSMIMGLAVHGRWKEALEHFHEMRAEGIKPDDITLVGVLLSCNHGGLVDQGRHYFETMENEFSLSPKLEHYGCMVDLLGRAGLLTEAYGLVTSMPVKPDSVIWGTLLGACSFYGEIGLAEIASKFLFELEPWNPGNYVILSNIYASSGRWDSVAEVWRLMKGKKYKKAAGYSFIELGGIVHKFLVEDESHPRSGDIYALLDEVSTTMKLHAYVPNLDFHVENH